MSVETLALGDFGPLAWALATLHLGTDTASVPGMAGCMLARVGLEPAALAAEVEGLLVAFPVSGDGPETTEGRRQAVLEGTFRCK